MAKFKCRRILLAEMGNERLKNKEAVTACVLRAVAGGSMSPAPKAAMHQRLAVLGAGDMMAFSLRMASLLLLLVNVSAGVGCEPGDARSASSSVRA